MILRSALAAALMLATPAGAPAQTAEPGMTTVLRLVESAQRAVKRDRLRAELRVEAAGAEARSVQAEINRRMAAALERARSTANVRAETGGYHVFQEQPQNAPLRWRGVQSLALIGSDFDAVLALAGALQEQGLVFSGMGFDLRPESARAVEDELTAEALARLRQRAEKIAGALGLAVVGIRELRVSNALGDRPRPPMPMRMEAQAMAVPPPVAEAGEQTVQVTAEGEILLGARRRP